MKRFYGLALFGILVFGSPSVQATTLSAGIREYFSIYGQNDYASDSASKLKMLLTDLGFPSITLQTRIAADALQATALYPPKFASRKEAIEIMISRIFHGNASPVIKPMIFVRPEEGAPLAASEITSADPQALFSSYTQVMDPFLSTLSLRSIDSFAIGSGMGAFLRPEFGPRLKAMIELMKSRSREVTRISLDLMNEAAIINLEAFYKADAKGFAATFDGVKEVRFALPIEAWLDPVTLTLKRDALLGLLRDRVYRLNRLFPGRTRVLSNVFFPACPGFTGRESEVDCGSIRGDWGKQTALVREFFSYWDELPEALTQAISGMELVVGSTQDEPLASEADPRFPIYNLDARTLLKERLKQTSHHSESFLSPARASFRLFSNQDQKKHACIYYDESGEGDQIGPIHARLIDNLVGAFRSWAKERRRLSGYHAGDLQDCDAVFYLASNFLTAGPDGFYGELSQFLQTHPVVWFNYKFDSFYDYYLKQRFKNGFDPILFNIPKILQADAQPTLDQPDPGFYRFFHYKGETFEKLARFDPVTHLYSASPEIGAVSILDPKKIQVLSVAEHSKTHAQTPYAVEQNFTQGGRLYYFADLPFSFNHYEDRSLIFSDLIYDILNEPAPKRSPIALVRLEDVSPAVPTEYLTQSIDYLTDRSVPYSLAIIPYYSNLFTNPMGASNQPVWQPADRFPSFTGFIRYAQARGAAFVMHGLAHQAGDLISGFNGGTGSDYEFWTWPGDRPHPQDSAEWVYKRLDLAEGVFDRLKIKVAAWEVPHYAASALDYVLFGREFEWNYHRGLYFKSEMFGPSDFSDESLSREARRDRAKSLTVKADYTNFGGQIFPYPIFEDSYGQAIIPETIGMVDFALYRPDTWRPVSTVDDLLRRAKKLKVIRGAVASFFWHPMLLDPKAVYYVEVPGSYDSIGGIKTLVRLVEGLKGLGYEFKSILDCSVFPRKECAGQ
jgi:uncharacterized protein YdaL